MTKTIWLASVTFLTVVTAAVSLKSSISETAAGPRLNPAQQISLPDLQRNADVQSMPVMKMNDMSFVFTDTECGMASSESTLDRCTFGSAGGRW
jgi:hypothetical protein